MTHCNKKLAILGAGGHGKTVAAIAEQLGWHVEFFDQIYGETSNCGGWSIVGDETAFFSHLNSYHGVFVAIGNNIVRQQKLEQIVKLQGPLISLVSPVASIMKDVSIGDGVVIMPNSAINIGSTISFGVIVNTGANIDHDSVIEACSHISPGANLAGEVTVGATAWVGIGASVIQQISIGCGSVVGAGSVIISHVPDNVTIVGCPGRIVN